MDLVLFGLAYVVRSQHTAEPVTTTFTVVYLIAMFAGLVLAIYSFITLTTGGDKELRKSVVCALFALAPACFGLVTVLSHIGTPVGNVHV